MIVVQVHVRVKPEYVEAFRKASLENAAASLGEPGIARFDVLQQEEEPSRFILFEEYRYEEAAVKHKKTAHYAKWRDTVADMMAEPRFGVRYFSAFPIGEAE